MFAIVQLIRATPPEEGWEPDFPSDTAFGLLAEARASRLGVYQYTLSDEHEGRWSPDCQLSKIAVALLESGFRWPPALALARQTVDSALRVDEASPELVESTLIDALSRGLRRANSSEFHLVENLVAEVGYREQGEWFWVRAHPASSDKLQWVSDDFYLYTAGRDEFSCRELK